MEKEFVTYELSLRLKELGFDEPCFGRYYYKESYPMLNPQSEETELVFEFGKYIRQTEVTLLAPLYSQAFRWFREKYQLHNGIYPYYDEYEFQIKDFRLPINTPINGGLMPYEEAELDCLEKLIEIVENEKTL